MVGRHLGTMAVIALGTVIATQAVSAQEPKYGGTLTIVPYSPGIAALSWDPADWNCKVSIDAGPYMEQLMVGDLSKGVRGGGKNNFFSEAWLSDDVLRRLAGWPMPLADLPEHFAARPEEFIVRDVWQEAWLPEALQGRAASLVDLARNGHVGVDDWRDMAEALEVSTATVNSRPCTYSSTSTCRDSFAADWSAVSI